MDQGEVKMRETHAAALKRIRDEFQAKYPHYTPPPDATRETWGAWVLANIDLHGDEFAVRFPAQHAIMQRNEIDPDAVHDALHNLAYPTQPRHTARAGAYDLAAG